MFSTLSARRALVGALLVLAATPALAGPPWLSVEFGPNPYHPATRDAYLVVHATHRGAPSDEPPSGVAEGIVNGQRKSIALRFDAAGTPGAFKLRKQWSDGTRWVLALSVGNGHDDTASALVTVGSDGRVAGYQTLVKKSLSGDAGPRMYEKADIDAALNAIKK
jgi:hypothetical protein